MATVFIAGLAVKLEQRWRAGQELDEVTAGLLNEIKVRRTVAKLRYLLDKGDLSPAELPAKAIELQCQPLERGTVSADLDSDEDDPILTEALEMAKELLIAHMASEGLPPPKGLELHAKALVDARPDLQELARKRVEARFAAAAAAMANLEQ